MTTGTGTLNPSPFLSDTRPPKISFYFKNACAKTIAVHEEEKSKTRLFISETRKKNE